MPYKDKEKKTQRQKERRLKPQQSEAPIIEAPHNTNSAAQETVPASYVPGTNGKQYQMLPERPRYLTLSDRQVLDRANQPIPLSLIAGYWLWHYKANDCAFGYVPNIKPLPPELRRRFALKPAGKAV